MAGTAAGGAGSREGALEEAAGAGAAPVEAAFAGGREVGPGVGASWGSVGGTLARGAAAGTGAGPDRFTSAGSTGEGEGFAAPEGLVEGDGGEAGLGLTAAAVVGLGVAAAGGALARGPAAETGAGADRLTSAGVTGEGEDFAAAEGLAEGDGDEACLGVTAAGVAGLGVVTAGVGDGCGRFAGSTGWGGFCGVVSFDAPDAGADGFFRG